MQQKDHFWFLASWPKSYTKSFHISRRQTLDSQNSYYFSLDKKDEKNQVVKKLPISTADFAASSKNWSMNFGF